LSIDAGAVLGRGVVVKKSTIPGAGNGLFTTKVFQPGASVTEYDGVIIGRTEAVKLREKGEATHCRSLGYHLVIDGREIDVEKGDGGIGRGGGAFANHGGSASINSHFVTRQQLEGVSRKGLQSLDRVFIVADRELAAGEEVMVSYGKGFWCMCPGDKTSG